MQIVNGYVCKDCTDVLLATKGVDPAHPKDGPNGQNRIADEKAQDHARELATSGVVGTRLSVMA